MLLLQVPRLALLLALPLEALQQEVRLAVQVELVAEEEAGVEAEHYRSSSGRSASRVQMGWRASKASCRRELPVDWAGQQAN